LIEKSVTGQQNVELSFGHEQEISITLSLPAHKLYSPGFERT
jgi:hypothetical protein